MEKRLTIKKTNPKNNQRQKRGNCKKIKMKTKQI